MSLDRLGKDGVMRRIALTFALVGVLALGACGGEASPKPAPLTPTPSASSQAQAGARLVREWIEALNRSGPTLDTGSLRSLSADSCKPCQNIITSIEQTKKRGGSISGDGWTDIVTTVRSQSDSAITVDATVTVNPQTVVIKAGAQAKRFEGALDVPKQFVLRQQSDRWQVADLRQEDELQ